MKKAVYLLLTTLLSLQVFAQQQSVQSFSLQQAVDYAKKNNYTLVLDAQAVVYAADSADITKQVAGEFDKK